MSGGVSDSGARDGAVDSASALLSSENCGAYGDDDGDGLSDCADPYCASTYRCVNCGNGVVDALETCDDGNRIDTDACTNACLVAACGDGVVHAGVEVCDAFFGTSFQCKADCSAPYHVCGDGLRGPGEDCDDGNLLAGDSCSPSCRFNVCGDGDLNRLGDVSMTLSWRGYVDADVENLVVRWNGFVVASVPMDELDACAAAQSVTFVPTGFRDVARVHGNWMQLEVPTGAHVAYAHIRVDVGGRFAAWGVGFRPRSDVPDCASGVAGPFVVGASSTFGLAFERCDGITDGCPSCMTAPHCGDGVVQPELGEACDGTPDCTGICELRRCGDGVVEGAERCDDGNESDGDGCTACQFDDCGNGVVEGWEPCDDGNAIDDDACIECTPARCGDGHLFQERECCDDGNLLPLDGCDIGCYCELEL